VYMLRAAWNARVIEELRQFPNGKHDEACFIEGTMITTASGLRPIENVCVGEMVLTRAGYRRVLNSGLTNAFAGVFEMNLSNGESLIGTANHPIFTLQKGFLPLDTCADYDILYLCENISHPRLLTRLFTKASRLTAIRTPRMLVTAIITVPMRVIFGMVSALYTERYGRTPTVQSRRVAISITKMATPSTMTFPTLSASGLATIANCIQSKVTTKPMLHAPRCEGLRNLQRNGIVAQKDGSGTGKMLKKLMNRVNCGHLSARLAALCLNRRITAASDQTALDSALRIARLKSDGKKDASVWKRCVNRALSRSLGCPAMSVVPVAVHSVCGMSEKRAVYNLTVEDEHEYFANGVLVHNCDTGADCFDELATPDMAPAPQSTTVKKRYFN